MTRGLARADIRDAHSPPQGYRRIISVRAGGDDNGEQMSVGRVRKSVKKRSVRKNRLTLSARDTGTRTTTIHNTNGGGDRGAIWASQLPRPAVKCTTTTLMPMMTTAAATTSDTMTKNAVDRGTGKTGTSRMGRTSSTAAAAVTTMIAQTLLTTRTQPDDYSDPVVAVLFIQS